MSATAVLDRPVVIEETGYDKVAPCDSKTVDPATHPKKVLSRCPHPAEWCYVMKCCGGRPLACGLCHEQHQRPTPEHQTRYCVICERPFITLAQSTVAIYRI